MSNECSQLCDLEKKVNSDLLISLLLSTSTKINKPNLRIIVVNKFKQQIERSYRGDITVITGSC